MAAVSSSLLPRWSSGLTYSANEEPLISPLFVAE